MCGNSPQGFPVAPPQQQYCCNHLLAQMLLENANHPEKRPGTAWCTKLSDVSLLSHPLALREHEVRGEMHATWPRVWGSQRANRTSKCHVETQCSDANEPIFWHLLSKFQEITEPGHVGGKHAPRSPRTVTSIHYPSSHPVRIKRMNGGPDSLFTKASDSFSI